MTDEQALGAVLSILDRIPDDPAPVRIEICGDQLHALVRMARRGKKLVPIPYLTKEALDAEASNAPSPPSRA